MTTDSKIKANSTKITSDLFQNISIYIETARTKVANYANSSLIRVYWQIGQRIHSSILKEARAEYGEQVINQLAQKLIAAYGRGFEARSLRKMVQFARFYPDEAIWPTLSAKLSWSHWIEIIALTDQLKRQFYLELCHREHWSVRELRDKINGMLYERTAISHKPEEVIQSDLNQLEKHKELSQDLVFRDPYVLDFLQLPAEFSESDLENAILDELCKFLQELGTDFCFLGRQKRITVDDEDFYIDLLTYHRGLKRLIAIELKLGKFQASHKGQMELYLRWLDKYERKPGENKPLGLILCSEKQKERVELLELDKSGIHVAQYLTELPSKEVLEDKLRKAIKIARTTTDTNCADTVGTIAKVANNVAAVDTIRKLAKETK
jgi:predicted nuclease of restriction endonuclease-like (RecB) superfamily